jgi:hypothetical protein
MPYESSGETAGLLRHRRGGASTVHRDRRGEHECRHSGVDSGVQQIDASDDVVRVVESLDEMTEAFGRVRSEVIDMLETAVREHAIDETIISDAAMDERGS